MEAIIIPKDQFQALLARIEQIHNRVEQLTPNQTFIDNSEFIQLMKISKRTAQTWRDEKIIAFSQVGAKIYYKLTDVEHLLKTTQIPSTKKY
ncbi:MAG: helix-turn-helix domain-containing protein [Bacteroidales bacterium]|nr:helix-turn-helix domain-containing protein [Bacteroidales bacterium]